MLPDSLAKVEGEMICELAQSKTIEDYDKEITESVKKLHPEIFKNSNFF